jgi:hypothetical protein
MGVSMSRKARFADENHLRNFSRRDFFKSITAAGMAGVLSQCAPIPQPADSPTFAGTRPIAELSMANVRRLEIIQFWPDTTSKVVHTHDAGVWYDGELAAKSIRKMPDASITALTGLDDARDARAALFTPPEWIAIKVNTLYGGLLWTHTPLVTAVTECLQDAGIPAEQIVVYDRSSEELARTGFTVSRNGSRVCCCCI